MNNPASQSGMLTKHQFAPPFPLRGQKNVVNARATSLLSRALGGAVSLISRTSQSLLSNAPNKPAFIQRGNILDWQGNREQ